MEIILIVLSLVLICMCAASPAFGNLTEICMFAVFRS